jgi:hypothetical protein
MILGRGRRLPRQIELLVNEHLIAIGLVAIGKVGIMEPLHLMALEDSLDSCMTVITILVR